MTTHKEALTALVHEMEYVLSCINADKVPFDGDDFHEALRLGKEALAQPEQDKERCVGCEACIDTACGRDECPKGWPKAAQPSGSVEQEPVAWMVYTLDGTSVCVTDNPADFTPEHRALPLYTAPPQPSAIARKPLTDKQLNIIGSRWHLNLLNAEEKAELFAFAHAIEAAHGIKGDA